MLPDRTRWTDDRLDDLHTLVSTLDARVDSNTKLVDAHDRDLGEIGRTGDRRRDTNRTVILMLTTVLATELAQVILKLTGAG